MMQLSAFQRDRTVDQIAGASVRKTGKLLLMFQREPFKKVIET